MKINSFEDILSWKKAKSLSIDIYRNFSTVRDYGFRDQIQRASVSIMSNIAEGFERGTNPDFRRFLFIAKGSCGETRSLLQLAKELGYLSEKKFDILYTESVEISKLLSGLIKKL